MCISCKFPGDVDATLLGDRTVRITALNEYFPSVLGQAFYCILQEDAVL